MNPFDKRNSPEDSAALVSFWAVTILGAVVYGGIAALLIGALVR